MKNYGYYNIRGTNYSSNIKIIPEELLETEEEKINLRKIRKIICDFKQKQEKINV